MRSRTGLGRYGRRIGMGTGRQRIVLAGRTRPHARQAILRLCRGLAGNHALAAAFRQFLTTPIACANMLDTFLFSRPILRIAGNLGSPDSGREGQL